MEPLILSLGELLWDLLPGKRILGGAPSNLAFRLTELGRDCRIVSRVGRDELGREALERVSELGLSTEFIQLDEQHPTGTVDVSFDVERNPDYVINPGVAYDFLAPVPELLEAAKTCRCLIFGTLAQRNETTRKTLALLMEQTPDAIRFMDINLRKDCYERELILNSFQKTDILKINHHEMEMVKNMFGLTARDLPDLTEELAVVFNIRTVVVTLEEMGAFLFDIEEGKHYLPGYAIKLEDPLGAGDAFSAVFIHHLLNGDPLQEACMRGNMLGAAVATTQGATHPLDFAYVRNITDPGKLNIRKELSDFLPAYLRSLGAKLNKTNTK